MPTPTSPDPVADVGLDKLLLVADQARSASFGFWLVLAAGFALLLYAVYIRDETKRDPNWQSLALVLVVQAAQAALGGWYFWTGMTVPFQAFLEPALSSVSTYYLLRAFAELDDGGWLHGWLKSRQLLERGPYVGALIALSIAFASEQFSNPEAVDAGLFEWMVGCFSLAVLFLYGWGLTATFIRRGYPLAITLVVFAIAGQVWTECAHLLHKPLAELGRLASTAPKSQAALELTRLWSAEGHAAFFDYWHEDHVHAAINFVAKTLLYSAFLMQAVTWSRERSEKEAREARGERDQGLSALHAADQQLARAALLLEKREEELSRLGAVVRKYEQGAQDSELRLHELEAAASAAKGETDSIREALEREGHRAAELHEQVETLRARLSSAVVAGQDSELRLHELEAAASAAKGGADRLHEALEREGRRAAELQEEVETLRAQLSSAVVVQDELRRALDDSKDQKKQLEFQVLCAPVAVMALAIESAWKSAAETKTRQEFATKTNAAEEDIRAWTSGGRLKRRQSPNQFFSGVLEQFWDRAFSALGSSDDLLRLRLAWKRQLILWKDGHSGRLQGLDEDALRADSGGLPGDE